MKASDIMKEIQRVRDGLADGSIPVDRANAEGRLFRASAEILKLRFKHAEKTERLERGSEVMPDFELEESFDDDDDEDDDE